MTLDDLRAAYPELGFALYAMEPHGAVTFEIYAVDGQVYSWKAATAAEAIALAFPPLPLSDSIDFTPLPAEPDPEPKTELELGLFD